MHEQAIETLRASGVKFEARGNTVVFKNPLFKLRGRLTTDLPQHVLLQTFPVKAQGYGEVVSDHDMARLFAEFLNGFSS